MLQYIDKTRSEELKACIGNLPEAAAFGDNIAVLDWLFDEKGCSPSSAWYGAVSAGHANACPRVFVQRAKRTKYTWVILFMYHGRQNRPLVCARLA